MDTVILACNTIKDEIELAAEKTQCIHPIIWIESGLHLVPASLRCRIQEELDKIDGPRRVILAFGFCGNSIVGIKTGNFELVIPKVDDCITLLLGSKDERARSGKNGGTYYLTRGWLEGEVNIWEEYRSVLARFGPERTARIYKVMLAHYKYLGLIDTGAYDLPGLMPYAREISSTLNLELTVLPGTDLYLKRLLTGPWDDDSFLRIPPFTTIDLANLGVCSDKPSVPGQLGLKG